MHGVIKPDQGSEAKLEYQDGTFRVLLPGNYVTCAVSGRRIPLDELRYWSVVRQEAYADGLAATKAFGSPE